MLENAVYSVISPESCAAIIYRDASKGEAAAVALKITASDLNRLGLIDGIVPEPPGGAQEDPDRAAELLKQTVVAAITELSTLSGDDLIEERYDKFRRMGNFFEEVAGA
jgi:acetyl-CoA carboxylase alpha subunit